MRVLLIKAVDDVFKTATLPLREATDLRENMQVGHSSKTLLKAY